MTTIASNDAAIEALLSDRADAYAGTGLTVSQLGGQSPDVEVVEGFEDPKVDGKIVRSWGGFTFPPTPRRCGMPSMTPSRTIVIPRNGKTP